METDHILCPNCLKQQIDINLPEESKIKCLDCSKEFIYLKCYHCKKKITMKNLEYIDGTNIQCPFPNCGKYFSKSSCAICVKPYFSLIKIKKVLRSGALLKIVVKSIAK